MSVATALALLTLGGTALAARTGTLPDDAQQHAHRLFSALGVPAPGTGPGDPSPTRSPSPSPTTGAPAGPAVAELGWCADWQPGGPSLSSENHRRLRAAAGGEEHIPRYCDRLRSLAPTRTPAPPPRSGPGVRTVTPSGRTSPPDLNHGPTAPLNEPSPP
jgi:hypothetical protein